MGHEDGGLANWQTAREFVEDGVVVAVCILVRW